MYNIIRLYRYSIYDYNTGKVFQGDNDYFNNSKETRHIKEFVKKTRHTSLCQWLVYVSRVRLPLIYKQRFVGVRDDINDPTYTNFQWFKKWGKMEDKELVTIYPAEQEKGERASIRYYWGLDHFLSTLKNVKDHRRVIRLWDNWTNSDKYSMDSEYETHPLDDNLLFRFYRLRNKKFNKILKFKD